MEKFNYYFVYQPLDQELPTISFGGETTKSFDSIQETVKKLLPNEHYLLVLSNFQKSKQDGTQENS